MLANDSSFYGRWYIKYSFDDYNMVDKEGDFMQILSQFHDLILCIISALEARDPYTSHHSSRVAEMTETICELVELDDEEWEIMKSHSEQGYNILMNAKSFEVVADVVKSHHERYDGKGYPDGLKGENIPLGARIIAIADSIDAMISDRPYRKGMDTNVCREQIERNIGIMYDPIIAKKVIEHWDKVLSRREDDSNQCMD